MSQDCFNHLRDIIMGVCSYVRAGDREIVSEEDALEVLAKIMQGDFSALKDNILHRKNSKGRSVAEISKERSLGCITKIDTIRYVIAMAVAIKLHLRICQQGQMPREQMVHAVQDVFRICSLLTPEEADIVRQSCGLYEEKHSGGFCCRGDGYLQVPRQTYTYSAYINRYWGSSDAHSKRMPIFGQTDQNICPVPLPTLLGQWLRDCIYRAVAKPWGYPERTMNILETCIVKSLDSFRDLVRLVNTPQPKPYIQILKIAVFLFGLMYPFHIDVSEGVGACVIVPYLISFVLVGLMVVASDIENPVGDNATDLNVLSMCHALEVEAEQVFDLSERLRTKVRSGDRALAQYFHLQGLKAGVIGTIEQKKESELAMSKGLEAKPEVSHSLGVGHLFHRNQKDKDDEHAEEEAEAKALEERQVRRRCFREFFDWRPLPARTVLYSWSHQQDDAFLDETAMQNMLVPMRKSDSIQSIEEIAALEDSKQLGDLQLEKGKSFEVLEILHKQQREALLDKDGVASSHREPRVANIPEHHESNVIRYGLNLKTQHGQLQSDIAMHIGEKHMSTIDSVAELIQSNIGIGLFQGHSLGRQHVHAMAMEETFNPPPEEEMQIQT